MLSDVQHSTAEAITKALEAQFSKMLDEGTEDLPSPEEALAPLTTRLEALPAAVGEAVRAAIPPMPDLSTLPQAIGAELSKALAQAQEAAMKELETVQANLPPEVTGAIGGLTKASNAKTADLKNAIGQGLLGPYGSLLQQFMPPLYDYLTENPDMVVQALEMPVVQKLIQKVAAAAGNVTQAAEAGWGR